jgi:hypothetical protein
MRVMQRQSAWGLVVFGWSRDVQERVLVCSGVARVLLVQQRPPGGGCRSWPIPHRVMVVPDRPRCPNTACADTGSPRPWTSAHTTAGTVGCAVPDGRIIRDHHYRAHRRIRARVEHVIARIKDWQILRQCRRRGQAINHSLHIVAGLWNLKNQGQLRVNS